MLPFRLTRRTALQAAGSALLAWAAGCASIPGSTSPSDQMQPLTNEDLSFDVTIVHQFTDNYPARLQVELTNESNASLVFFMGTTPPFTEYFSEDDHPDTKLLLIPGLSESLPGTSPFTWEDGDEGAIPATPASGCWEITRPLVVHDLGMWIDIAAGETLSRAYDIYAYRSSDCYTPGSYRFAHRAELQRGEAPGTDERPRYDVVLGFDLLIDEDRTLGVDVLDTVVSEHLH